MAAAALRRTRRQFRKFACGGLDIALIDQAVRFFRQGLRPNALLGGGQTGGDLRSIRQPARQGLKLDGGGGEILRFQQGLAGGQPSRFRCLKLRVDGLHLRDCRSELLRRIAKVFVPIQRHAFLMQGLRLRQGSGLPRRVSHPGQLLPQGFQPRPAIQRLLTFSADGGIGPGALAAQGLRFRCRGGEDGVEADGKNGEQDWEDCAFLPCKHGSTSGSRASGGCRMGLGTLAWQRLRGSVLGRAIHRAACKPASAICTASKSSALLG